MKLYLLKPHFSLKANNNQIHKQYSIKKKLKIFILKDVITNSNRSKLKYHHDKIINYFIKHIPNIYHLLKIGKKNFKRKSVHIAMI